MARKSRDAQTTIWFDDGEQLDVLDRCVELAGTMAQGKYDWVSVHDADTHRRAFINRTKVSALIPLVDPEDEVSYRSQRGDTAS